MDAATRKAEFDYWLHERGYRYTGEASIYRLTVSEMVRLYRGWRSAEERKAERAEAQSNPAGVGGRAGAGRGYGGLSANPHRRRAHGSPRQSDFDKLRELERDRAGESES